MHEFRFIRWPSLASKFQSLALEFSFGVQPRCSASEFTFCVQLQSSASKFSFCVPLRSSASMFSLGFQVWSPVHRARCSARLQILFDFFSSNSSAIEPQRKHFCRAARDKNAQVAPAHVKIINGRRTIFRASGLKKMKWNENKLTSAPET